MYKKVLVPLDGSALAEKVLPHVSALAKATGAEVTLITVIQLTMGASASKLEAAPEAHNRALMAEAQLYLQKVQRDLKNQWVAAHYFALEGDIAGEIITYGEQKGFDLIAMATHGRSGVDRFIMGSIAEKVVRSTVKPVLLIRALAVIPRQVPWADTQVGG
jgi:nucleotide-binding universal stress UspA family protein